MNRSRRVAAGRVEAVPVDVDVHVDAEDLVLIDGPFDEELLALWRGELKIIDAKDLARAFHETVCEPVGLSHDDDSDIGEGERLFTALHRQAFMIRRSDDAVYVTMVRRRSSLPLRSAHLITGRTDA